MAPGMGQILIVLLIVVLLFGASRVPVIAENLAKGIKSFKQGLKDEDEPKAAPKKVAKKASKDEAA